LALIGAATLHGGTARKSRAADCSNAPATALSHPVNKAIEFGDQRVEKPGTECGKAARKRP
jgi:hypothetical protein